LNISTRRVRALIAAGRMPAKRLGRDWIIAEPDLDAVRDRQPGRPKKANQEES
jgi:excisionase family DNA binding protein